MIDDIVFNGVKVFNPIEGKLDKVIEQFVSYYGEEHRERITKNINNTTFFFLPKLGTEEQVMEGKSSDTISMARREFERQRDNLKRELNLKYFPPSVVDDIDPENVVDINKRLQNGEKLQPHDKYVISQIGKSLYIKPLNIFGYEKYSKSQMDKIKQRIQEYSSECLEVYSPMLEQIFDEGENAIAKIKQYIPDADEILAREKADIEEIKLTHFKRFIKRQCITATDEDIQKHFSTYSKLQDHYTLFNSCSYKEDVVELFKFLKIGTSNDYDYYYNNSSYFDGHFFSADLRNDIYLRRAESYKERNHKNDILQEALKKIDSLDIKYEIDKRDIMRSMANFATNKTSGFVSHYLGDNGELKMVCVCEDYFSLPTSTFVHEINHIIDSFLVENNAEYYVVKCGIDAIKFQKDDQVVISEPRNREVASLDEILNEYYSGEVYKKFESEGLKIGAIDGTNSSYRVGFPTFYNLFKNFENELLIARQSQDNSILDNLFGEKNYSRLCGFAEEVLHSITMNSQKAVYEIVEKTNFIKAADINAIAHTYEDQMWSRDAKSYLETISRANECIETLINYAKKHSQEQGRDA